MKPQTLAIYNALKQGQSLTSLMALRQFGCSRLASRINEINHEISPERVKVNYLTENGKRFAEYSIPDTIPSTPAPLTLPSGVMAMNF